MRKIKRGRWQYIGVCPKTGEYLSEMDYAYSSGLCPRCGDQARSTFTHRQKLVYRKIRVTYGWKFWKNFSFYDPKNSEEKDKLLNLGYKVMLDADSELEQWDF